MDSIDPNTVAVLCAIVGAFIWPTAEFIRGRLSLRRSGVGGYWLQLTYEPEISDAVPGTSEAIMSIEFVEVRHVRRQVHGTMWRVYRRDFDRRWQFTGHVDSLLVRGEYTLDRGHGGGDGTFNLLRLSGGFLWGQFVHSVVHRAGKNRVTLDPEDYALEWVSLDDVVMDGVFAVWLDQTPLRIRDLYPQRVRRRLYGAKDLALMAADGMAAGTAATDLTQLAALQRLRVEESDTAWKQIVFRRSDIVAEEGGSGFGSPSAEETVEPRGI
jgi:hypothetical protein